MLVWKTSFRFPEINLGFVTSARGAEHLTPKKFLGRGSFDQRKGPHGGEFDQKMSNARESADGGGGMGTLGFDSYITETRPGRVERKVPTLTSTSENFIPYYVIPMNFCHFY